MSDKYVKTGWSRLHLQDRTSPKRVNEFVLFDDTFSKDIRSHIYGHLNVFLLSASGICVGIYWSKGNLVDLETC